MYASLSWIERKKTGGRKNKIGAEKAENQASSQKNVEKLPTPEELEKLRQSANK